MEVHLISVSMYSQSGLHVVNWVLSSGNPLNIVFGNKVIDMKKRISFTALLLLALLTCALSITPVYAATSIKTSSCKYTTSAAKAEKYAKKVSTGAYTVKTSDVKKGYLKFTPASSGTYEFKFFNIKSSFSFAMGHITFQVENGSSLKRLSVKTKGGTTNTLNLATQNDSADEGAPEELYLKSRSTRIKLTKGKTVYIHYGFLVAKSFQMFIDKVS